MKTCVDYANQATRVIQQLEDVDLREYYTDYMIAAVREEANGTLDQHRHDQYVDGAHDFRHGIMTVLGTLREIIAVRALQDYARLRGVDDAKISRVTHWKGGQESDIDLIQTSSGWAKPYTSSVKGSKLLTPDTVYINVGWYNEDWIRFPSRLVIVNEDSEDTLIMDFTVVGKIWDKHVASYREGTAYNLPFSEVKRLEAITGKNTVTYIEGNQYK
jgi:hypothetical protein